MNEVSVVARLIQAVLGFAIAAALVGSLGDAIFDAKGKAAQAVKRGGISYGQWNRKLQSPARKNSEQLSQSPKRKNGGSHE